MIIGGGIPEKGLPLGDFRVGIGICDRASFDLTNLFRVSSDLGSSNTNPSSNPSSLKVMSISTVLCLVGLPYSGRRFLSSILFNSRLLVDLKKCLEGNTNPSSISSSSIALEGV
jgi:hypothetical protein